ncbi:hypothetical protein CPB85DRAFT_395513 [Mucidula mucida]|nr:hypothetical protein CPB85DRAFT_395513 [Mucidula mucida]
MWHHRRGRICGVLNDFDLSSFRNAIGASSKQRTGTRPFMAHELHALDANGNPPVHLYRHDLESIFYLIILLTCAYALKKEPNDDGSHLHANKSSPCYSWFSMSDIDLHDKKYKLISRYTTLSIPVTHDSFQGFAAWIKHIYLRFERGMISKAKVERAAALLNDPDMDIDDDLPATTAFDEETMDGAVSYAAILAILKTFGKDDSGRKRPLKMMYPFAKKD